MPVFKVQESLGGTAITFGSSWPGVEIAIESQDLRQHGNAFVLAGPLRTVEDIDQAVNRLVMDLDAARFAAMEKLADYRCKATAGAG
jgi:hypothetical protein